ncbi:MAG TPA: glycosyltransferase family 2 protein [Pirellulaceae bacterium]|nr:glycosyltransferase family 2 protein [Pirellulaceae bacterium]
MKTQDENSSSASPVELTVLMPCLNESETLEACITKAWQSIRELGVSGEVLIADNGSSDGSQEIARQCGARVVDVPIRGYGAALQAGIEAARGKYIIMGDADDSYDFARLGPFVEKLRAGYDLVMGNRFRGGIAPGAMPPLHRYLGNPVLSFVGRLFFRNGIKDFHCGLRGFSKDAAERMELQTTGMEFASEMVVKASLLKMRVTEVPTTLSPDGRSRPPHLRSWRDGWRHLRFLLMYSPRWLFLYPGLMLMAIGLATSMALAFGPLQVFGVVLDIHTMLYAAAMVIVGFQAVLFAVFTKRFAIKEGLLPHDPKMERAFRWINLETGLLMGGGLLLLGIGGTCWSVWDWWRSGFGDLDPRRAMRWVIASVLLLSLGIQIGLGSFFLSILSLRRKNSGRSLQTGTRRQT